jgi:hypothetical protein
MGSRSLAMGAAASLFLFAVAPRAGAAIVVVGELSQERVVEPGKAYPGAIAIRNLGDAAEMVKVYLTDYLFYRDGSNLYGEPGKAPRSNARWITLNPSILSIPARETAKVSYQIAVPADPSLKGTYWSIAMVEGMGEAVPQVVDAQNGRARVGVRHVVRYGVQLVTDIGESGTRSLKFDTRLVRAEGKRLLEVDVENTGERWLRPSLWAQLFDEEGRFVGKFDGRRARVYPGTSVRKSIDLSTVPPGTYRALVVADAGEDSVYGATYTLKLETEKAEK